MSSNVMTGTIRKLLADKYCGFIQVPDSREGDYFFHVSGMQADTVPYSQLREGMTVEFVAGQGPKGLRAEEVRVAE